MIRIGLPPFPNGKTLFLVLVGMVCATSVLIGVHSPLKVWSSYPIDDGLFVSLGQHLAAGNWLGPYDQFTLAKGPGYPLFLALASWSGISVVLAQLLFNCFAALVFTRIVLRISGSRSVALAVLGAALLHPAVPMDRLLRDTIYPGQTLLAMACWSALLLPAGRGSARPVVTCWWGLAAGFMLGWFWITREEGPWLLPALVLLILLSAIRHVRAGSPRPWSIRSFGPHAIALAAFAAILISVRLLNWMAYGSFTAVDFKERHFKQALAALQSVRDGEQREFVPISEATRRRVYAVSPTFASLEPILEQGSKGFRTSSCRVIPSTCGDLGGGWFLWALRDAVEKTGNYGSAADASAFFAKVENEVRAACELGSLDCRRWSTPFIASMTEQQILRAPAELFDGIVATVRPPYRVGPYHSKGRPVEVERTLAFLNSPLHWPVIDSGTRIKLRGWYYQKNGEWPHFEVLRPDGSPGEWKLQRKESPDLAIHFEDTEATRQRFEAISRCSERCTLRVTTDSGASRDIPFRQFFDGQRRFRVGGILRIKKASFVQTYHPTSDHRVQTFAKIRYFSNSTFRLLVAPLFFIGGLAFTIAAVRSWNRREASQLLIFTTFVWAAFWGRIAVLWILQISTFPAFQQGYLAPAYWLVTIAPLLSIAAVRESLRG